MLMNNKTKGMVFDFKRYAVHDGPGIRTTVFLKGCPLSCWWCHNPESRLKSAQYIEKNYKIDGVDHIKEELVGNEMTVKEVLDEVEKDFIFYDSSEGGVTFSGGEVFTQPEFVEALLIESKRRGIHTCVDTTGYVKPEILEKVMDNVDIFLFDVKLINDEDHIKYTGVSNRMILDNLRRIRAAGVKLKIRVPLIPGITDTDRNLEGIAELVNELSGVDLDILPYHTIGIDKYNRLKMECLASDIKPPSKERVEEVCTFFKDKNINVYVGG